jgi:FKBP-type peptidyl-prolyl cis-trans isomerase FkpA
MIKHLSRIAPIAAALLPAAALAAPAPAAAPAAGIIKLPLQPVVPADMRTCSTKTPSGLSYTVLRDATGPKPSKTDFVLINYIGYLAAGGQVFDQNQGTPLGLDNVLPGFSAGLQLMPRGAVWRLCIPAAQGYGAQGAGEAIPANADLVFQVELVDSKTAAEVEAMRKTQDAAEATPGAPAAGAPAPAQH